VLLARPVDVEVAKTRDLRRSIRQHPPHVLVEQELRVAVDVERPLELALLAEDAAAAVDGRARRVDERHVVVLAPIEQRDRVAVVVPQHVAAVGLHRVRAGALMEHRATSSSKSPSASRARNSSLSTYSAISQSTRFANFSARVRLSTAMIAIRRAR
jgi:hypothetical protein